MKRTLRLAPNPNGEDEELVYTLQEMIERDFCTIFKQQEHGYSRSTTLRDRRQKTQTSPEQKGIGDERPASIRSPDAAHGAVDASWHLMP